MSKRGDLKARIHTLGEVKSILSAMKNISTIEMNKVSRYFSAQNELVVTIEEALGDYEQFFDGNQGIEQEDPEMLYVLLGSERGFCGGFNEAIIDKFNEVTSRGPKPKKIITIGKKLASKFDGHESIDGPNSAEEIASSITQLVRLLTQFPKMRWTLIHHENSDALGKISAVCPLAPKVKTQAGSDRLPPLLNLSQAELYPQLLEQYLFSVLYRAFYLSFLAENSDRLRHMDGALQTLDKNWNQLHQMNNRLRQEEITEELEVIMLSMGG